MILCAGLPRAEGTIVSDVDWPRPPIPPHDLPLIRELLSKEEYVASFKMRHRIGKKRQSLRGDVRPDVSSSQRVYF